MYSINLNSIVSIELNEDTIDVIKSKLNGTPEFKEEYISNIITPNVYKKQNNKDYLNIALWEVMYLFGDKMSLGSNIPIGLNILLKEIDCKQVL